MSTDVFRRGRRIERVFSLRSQAWLWSFGYLAFVLATAAVGRRVVVANRLRSVGGRSSWDPVDTADSGEHAPIEWSTRLLWLALSGTAVVMLLSITNQMTLEVAQIPLLWVVPLTVYLLSFIITFARPSLYRRGIFGVPLVIAMTLIVRTLVYNVGSLTSQVLTYSIGLFFITMSLHGELVRLRPAPRRLTDFYLVIAAGGALGGASVALVTPRVFPGLWELHVGLVATAGLIGISWVRETRRVSAAPDTESPEPSPMARRFAPAIAFIGWAALLAGSVLMVRLLVNDVVTESEDTIAAERSFYGVLRVVDQFPNDSVNHHIALLHGPIEHGFQYASPDRVDWPTAYYSAESGVGITIGEARKIGQGGGDMGPLSVGIVGLGSGTLAAYGKAGDEFTFYEIDPVVLALSETHFTYISRAEARGAHVEVLLGDARLVMEAQLEKGSPPSFNVLALDAFNGAAVPVHLLTEEAFEIYWQLVSEDGAVVVHVSNLHLDLSPVVRKLAEINDKQAVLIENFEVPSLGVSSSSWIIVTSNPEILDSTAVSAVFTPWDERDKEPILWTDDFSNLLAILD